MRQGHLSLNLVTAALGGTGPAGGQHPLRPPPAAASPLVLWRDSVRRYYFVVDLIKKVLVAVLTGGVLVGPFAQAGVLIAATSAQALFVLVAAPIKDRLFQALEVFSCSIDATTFVCGLALLYEGIDTEAVGFFMLAINVLSIIVQLGAIGVSSFGAAAGAAAALLPWLRRRCCGADVSSLPGEGAPRSVPVLAMEALDDFARLSDVQPTFDAPTSRPERSTSPSPYGGVGPPGPRRPPLRERRLTSFPVVAAHRPVVIGPLRAMHG